METKSNKTISVRLDNALYEKLCQIAAQEGRSVSGQVQYWIRKTVENHTKTPGA